MSPVDAAFRLYMSTPAERIRTHYRTFGEVPTQGQRYKNGQLPPWLIEEYKQLRASGRTLREVRNVLRVGPRTMTKLGALSEHL